MTKKQIKQLIKTNIRTQGALGIDLAKILNHIVNAIPESAEIPVASADTLGGVKVGDGLSVTEEGVLSSALKVSKTALCDAHISGGLVSERSKVGVRWKNHKCTLCYRVADVLYEAELASNQTLYIDMYDGSNNYPSVCIISISDAQGNDCGAIWLSGYIENQLINLNNPVAIEPDPDDSSMIEASIMFESGEDALKATLSCVHK